MGATVPDTPFGGRAAAQPDPIPWANGELDHGQHLVEALGSDATRPGAVTELLKWGGGAVPPLVEALGRREPDLRVHAFEVLKRLVPTQLQFDPFAAEEIRAHQLVALRQQLGFSR